MKRKNVNLNNNISTDEQKEKKQDNKIAALILLLRPYLKYILATIAIIVAVIAVLFGESKYMLEDTVSANVKFNKLYYLNVETGEKFVTLKEAVDKATADNPTGKNTIRVLNGREETDAVTVPADKEIELDLNGKTVEFNIDAQSEVTSAITNNGTLTITDATEATEATDEYSYTFKDETKLQIGGTLKSNKAAVTNNGTATIEGTANIHGTGNDTYTIVNDGTFTVENGTIRSTNYRAIVNGESNPTSANITINDGTLIAENQGIRNLGNINQVTGQTVTAQAVKITGGRFETQINTIVNADASTGLIYITGGDIRGGLSELGTPTIYNGGNGKIIIDEANSGDTVITDYSSNAAIINAYSANATGITEIRAGTIISKSGNGIRNSENGTIIIGKDETAIGETLSVSTTVPSITGVLYGVSKISGTFKFYDGIIKAPAGHTIDGVVDEKQQGYTVVNGTEVIDGTTYETAFLQKIIPDTIINTESMYVPGAQVRVDGVHNWIGNDKEGKNYETTTWANLNGNDHNGTITLGNGKWGENYLEFDGTSSWVNLGAINSNYQTLEATFSIDEIKTYDQNIISNIQTGGGVIYVHSNSGYICGNFYINGGYREVASTVAVEPGKVYNVALTYDGKDVVLYINGEFIGKYTADTAAISNQTITTPADYNSNQTVMCLGVNPRGNETEYGFMDGKAYSAAVYDRALTDAEVLENATAGLALAGGPVSSGNLTYTVRFPDAVTGFTADDITLTNATTGTFTEVTPGKIYTIDTTVTAGNTNSSSITEKITVPDGAATIVSSNEPTTQASRTVSIAPAYQNMTSNKCYFKLQDAFNEVNAGETIQVLNSTMEQATTQTKGTSADPTNNIEENPVSLDLNGKTIGMTGTLTNSGVLTITGTGTLTNSANINTIINNGTLTAGGTLTINGTGSSATTLVNDGTFTLNGATVSSTNFKAIVNGYNQPNVSKVIILDGKVTAYAQAIDNYGAINTQDAQAVKISGGTVESTNESVIHHNRGAITISGGRIRVKAAGKSTITMSGTVNLDGGTLESVEVNGTKSGHGVWVNSGTLNVNNNTVIDVGQTGIWNAGAGTVNINGGTITSTAYYAIEQSSSGTITITDGTITGGTGKNAVVNVKTGTIEISGGNISTTNADAVSNNSTGTLTITGGTITTTTGGAGVATANGNVTITGGTITGASYGVWINAGTVTIGSDNGTNEPKITGDSCEGILNTKANVTILSGEIKSTASAGISQSSTGTLTVGNKSNAVSTTIPKIDGAANTYGAYIVAGTFNFYDGRITGKTGKSVSKEPNNTPTGYTRKITDNGNGTETSTLDNHYNVRYLSGNLLEGYTLFNSENSGDSFSGPVNGVYTGTLSTAYGGWYIDESKFTAGKTYLLRYKIQKTAGTLNNIGGYSAAATQLSFNVDGSSSSTIYNTPLGNITNDTNVHTVEFKFTYSPSSTSGAINKIYIQPNRGNSTSVTVNLYDVELYEVVREDTKTYGSTYGTLPTPTARTGYTQQGLARENLFDKNATPVNSSTYIKGDGTTTSYSEYSVYQVNIEPNTSYRIINSGGSIAPGYAIFDSSGNYLAGENYTNRNAITFTTPANAAYIKFSVVKDSASGRYDKDVFYLGKVVNGTDTINVTEDHEVYALWTPNKYTITLNNQNATTAGSTAIYEKYNYGYYTNTNLIAKMLASAYPITVPTKTGYTFGGYYTAVNGGGTQYINASGYITSSASAANFTANGTLYAKWTDNIAPVITSATASTTTDIASYVDFNATDAGSQIKYYNITTSNTAPTTWIPVVSTVETATETKYENSAAWARVFHHNTHWGNVFYSNADNYAEAKSSSTVDKYSVLGNLANYKNSSNWEFMLQYPDLSATQYNRWTQTVNPATTTVANGTGSETAGGYTAGHIDWNGNYWGGLTLSTAATCFINGSVGHGNWFYAIGAKEGWNGAIPGPNSTGISTVNLWARIDNLTNTTSANLTRRLGDLKSNTTYYVWVKDASGNTASKAVTVSNVDTTAPTASITSTNNVAASQTATLSLGDNKALDKYYWGTSDPANTNVTYVATSGTSQSITKTVSDGGTYYLAVLDKAGNRTITSKVFYKTTLTPNRGTVNPTSVITMSGNKFTIPTPGAVTGYTWGGWFKESGLTNSAGTTWTPTASSTLYGKWTANTYTVKYNGNGSTGGSTANSTHTYNTAKALTANGFTRTGYTFAGWSTASGTTAQINDSGEYTGTHASGASGYNDFKQYAVEGTFSSGNIYRLDVDVKGSGRLINYFYGNSGYLQVASWTSSDGRSGTNTDGANDVPLTSSYTHYTVTFKLGSTGNGNIVKCILFRAMPGCSATIKNIRLHKLTAATDVIYENQQSVTNLSSTQGATVNLYATWSPNIYKVTLDNQSATTAGTAAYWYKYNTTFNSIYYYTEAGCYNGITGSKITVPAKTGYTFGGYYTGTNGSGTQYINASGGFINNIYQTVGDKTLYAKWTGVQVGDSINYTPNSTSITSSNTTLPSGATLSGTINTSEATNWVVLDVTSSGDVLIVPTTYSQTTLQLRGVDGNNNGITALNTIAAKYLNTTYGQSARSLTIEDVNKREGHTANGTVNQMTFNSKYSVDSNLVVTKNSSSASRTFQSTAATGEYTYSATKFTSNGWLASRYMSFDSSMIYWGLRCIDSNSITGKTLFGIVNDGYDDTMIGRFSYPVIPVVTLKPNVITTKVNGVWQLGT